MSPAGDIRFIDFHTHNIKGGEGILTVMNLMAGDEVPVDFPGNTLFSAGIHPWQLTDDNLPQLQTELLLTAAHPHVVMIGEAGFDRIRGAQGEIQWKAFMFQASIASEMGKPMVIHCVKGWDDLTRAHREVKPRRPWVIHGFRGSNRLAATLANEGFWFSLGVKGIKPEVLDTISHDRILLETDDSGQPVEDVYRLFSSVAGYEEEASEMLIRDNFNSLLNFRL